MFASQITRVVTLADAGVEVKIRKLSARSLGKASEQRQMTVAAMSKGMGAELMRVFRDEFVESAKSAKKPVEPSPEVQQQQERSAVYATYDRDHALNAGIVSWTSPVKLEDGIPDLDEPTAELLFRAIIDLSVPPVAVQADAGKDDSALSTSI